MTADKKSSLRLSISFDGAPTEEGYPTLDIFPHRAHFHEDIQPMDLLIYIALACLRFYDPADPRARFNSSFANQILAVGFQAPFATLDTGALVFAYDQDLSCDVILDVTSDGVHLSDGRCLSIELYRYFRPHYGSTTSREPMMENGIFVNPEPRDLAMLFLIDAVLPIAPDRIQETAERIKTAWGRMVRLLDLGYPSGVAGSQSAIKHISDIWNLLIGHWLIRPDHIHSPDHIVASHDLRTFLDKQDQAYRDTCRAALQADTQSDTASLHRAIQVSSGTKLSTSSHAALQLSQDIRSIDTAIETAAPLDLLRPAAKRRQAKLRGVTT